MALFDYAEFSTVLELDGMSKMAFSFIKAQMDRDKEKYESICNRNKENGQKGGRPVKTDSNPSEPKKPTGLIENPSEPKKPDTDNDNDTGTDTDNDTIPYSPPKGGDDIRSESQPVEKADGTGTPADHSTTSEDRFNRFWAAYPRKVGKAAAEKVFKKLHPSEALLQKMFKTIEAEKKTLQWQRDNGQYIPHPTTWLNQGRWDDEVQSADGINQGNPSYDIDDFVKLSMLQIHNEGRPPDEQS